MSSLARARTFFRELYEAFQRMARQEMVRHSAGFEYLPMIARDDSSIADSDSWNHPRPQTASGLSHIPFSRGSMSRRSDPIVHGHIVLLQSCTRKMSNRNGLGSGTTVDLQRFICSALLWAGLRDWAHRTFTGFLNHASPLYCWREDDVNALAGQDWGDMPHNWASAECVRYLRHMFGALEDGKSLPTLNGITAAESFPPLTTVSRILQPASEGSIFELEPAGCAGLAVAVAIDRSDLLHPRFIPRSAAASEKSNRGRLKAKRWDRRSRSVCEEMGCVS